MKTTVRTRYFIVVALASLAIVLSSSGFAAQGDIELPQPSLKSDVSIEQALAARRSLRTYKEEPITLNELSQLMWAGQGITDPEKGYRTAPSGMRGYPLSLYAVTLNVTGVPQGAYRYDPAAHQLILVTPGDLSESFKAGPMPSGPPPGAAPPASATAGAPAPAGAPGASASPPGGESRPSPVDTAAVMIVITGDTSKTNESGYFLESGHVAQSIALQCVPLGMGLVTTRGFNESALKDILKLSDSEIPIYVLPAGKK